VRLDGSNLDARLALGQFLLLGKEEEFQQALEQADAVIAADPNRWEGHVLRGAALERLKRVDEAEASYKKALELQPDRSDLVRTLAGYYVRKGNRATAEPLYQQLVQKDPSAQSYMLYAGFLALDRARDADAEAAYRKGLEVAKDEEKADVYQAHRRAPVRARALRRGREDADRRDPGASRGPRPDLARWRASTTRAATRPRPTR
jgi:tetratricopeptide (TPR) repeat protein